MAEPRSPARPFRSGFGSDPIREWTIEIRHADSGDRLVTSVEVLSPSNKARGSNGRESYLKKREDMRQGEGNIVEIDLLRAGAPTTLAPIGAALRRFGKFDYLACVLRYSRSRTAEVYPIPLAERLPLIAIPLLKGDADVTVDLQPVFDRSYDVARFDQRAAYAKPPLTPEHRDWAERILRTKGLLT